MKPNGRISLILDVSYPHTQGVEIGMGIGALLSKMDLESAYKYVHVHPEDLKLQVFKFCNKNFVELRLAFGTASSPALFDWPNWCITRASMLLTGIPNQWVQKRLDDLCVATPPHKCDITENFVKTHR